MWRIPCFHTSAWSLSCLGRVIQYNNRHWLHAFSGLFCPRSVMKFLHDSRSKLGLSRFHRVPDLCMNIPLHPSTVLQFVL